MRRPGICARVVQAGLEDGDVVGVDTKRVVCVPAKGIKLQRDMTQKIIIGQSKGIVQKKLETILCQIASLLSGNEKIKSILLYYYYYYDFNIIIIIHYYY